MKNTLKLIPFCTILFVTVSAQAQSPIPTPKPVTQEARQKLRAQILENVRGQYNENTKGELALPMAMLGDWDTALRLAKSDKYNPYRLEELWHWRAMQLARAGKWQAVRDAAKNIHALPVRADALMYAARLAIGSGISLPDEEAAPAELRSLLAESSALLRQSKAGVSQRSYNAYLWAMGGDHETAERLFAEIYTNAKKLDDQFLAERGKHSEEEQMRMGFNYPQTRDVLRFQAKCGHLPAAMKHIDDVQSFDWEWMVSDIRTPADYETALRSTEKMPVERKVNSMLVLCYVLTLKGDKKGALDLYNQAQEVVLQLPKSTPQDKNAYEGVIYLSSIIAHFLGDPGMEVQAMSNLRSLAEQSPEMRKDFTLDDLKVWPHFLDLNPFPGARPVSLAPEKLEQIARELKAATPCDLQFRSLEALAARYWLQKRTAPLLGVAQAMLKSARAMEAAETAKRKKETGMFNPYWPRSPRVLTSVFWLQRAGNNDTAASFAREFATHVPDRERPYAAMALFQLGFPELADSTFNPLKEIPRLAAINKENWKRKKVDWNLFSNWSEFAAAEAAYRSPEAPLKWINKIEGSSSRAQILRAIVSALYPQPGLKPPYISVTSTGSSSAM